MVREYADFDLLVQRAADGFTARVVNSPSGESPPVRFAAPFAELELENFLLKIGRPRHAGVRGVGSPEAVALREFGGRLFDAVFQREVRDSLVSSLDQVEARGIGLRVRLRLADCPELAELPWECLYDAGHRRFLSLSEWTPLVRYLDLPGRVRPLPVHPPLRVLVLISSPSDYPPLNADGTDGEWSRLQEALGELRTAGRLHVDRMKAGNLDALQRQLRQMEYHVFHYVGHGGFDAGEGDGLLVLEGPHRRGQLVSGRDLGALLYDHRTLRLAVLNSCEGARGGGTDPYAGTSQSLVQQGIPAVVAMQFEITDEAAVKFSQAFYEALADNYPVDAAMAEARKGVRNSPNPVEWVTPVLYLRAPDGRLFDVDTAGLKTGDQRAKSAEDNAQRVANQLFQQESKDTALTAERLGGHWYGDYGDIYFKVSGHNVKAVYDYYDGRIVGTLHGGVMDGWWTQMPTRNPPEAGLVHFELLIRGGADRIEGSWASGRSGTWSPWNLRKVDDDIPALVQAKFEDAAAFN